MFIATGTYRFERGAQENSFGDEVDVPRRVIERVPGALSERNRMRSDGGVTMVVAVLSGRFRPGLDVEQGDRVINEQTGERYTVDDVHADFGIPLMRADTIIELKRVAK